MPDEEDAYDEKSVEEMKENDEVSSEEEAFMEGFTEDVEETETDPEDYFTTEKKKKKKKEDEELEEELPEERKEEEEELEEI